MKNAIATARITLNIPTERLQRFAEQQGFDLANPEHEELICTALENEIEHRPADWFDHEHGIDVEVTG